MTRLSRRGLLRLSVAAAAFAACGPGPADRSREQDSSAASETAAGTAQPPLTPARTATATPTRTPAPRGEELRPLLQGTAWETPMLVKHSGVRGPAALVLGGVHGNEPGGWLAAEEVLGWEPAAGSLLVVPRANVKAIEAFVRTSEGLGDLNRLYPGNASSEVPMERMAAAIIAAAREFQVELLLDLHESWAFYAESPPGSGTGALGQTITAGAGPLQSSLGARIAERVNPELSERERLVVRDGSPFSRPVGTPVPGQTGRGRSSLSAGGYVDGLTPVLVEMGQQNQALDRRVAIHVLVARAALELLGG